MHTEIDTWNKVTTNFRNGYLTANEQTVERVIDLFVAQGQYKAAAELRTIGQVAQDLLDLVIVAEPNAAFDWAAYAQAINTLREILT